MAASCGQIARFLVLVLIALLELGLICYLIWIGHLYIEYFTYMNKVVFMFTLWVIIISNVDYLAFQWITTIFLPFLLAIGLTIGIGVTVLAYYRPLLIVNDMDDSGDDPDGVALVHTGDWLFHQLPFYEAVIVAFCLYKQVSCALRYQLDQQITNRYARGFFIFFVCSLHGLFALFYCLIMPFDDLYLLGPPADAALPAGIVVAITIFSGVVTYFVFFQLMGKHPDAKHAGETMFVVAAAATRKRIREHITARNTSKNPSTSSESETQRANPSTTHGQYFETIDHSGISGGNSASTASAGAAGRQ